MMKLEATLTRLERFVLYETWSHMYLVGSDEDQAIFRLIKIDRRIENPTSLSQILRVDRDNYSKEDLVDMLEMISEGNKVSGGLVKVIEAFGVIGFVKFLDNFYINLITQRKQVGCIGGNYIYQIKANEMVPVRPKDEPDINALQKIWRKLNKKLNQTSKEIAESRYIGLFQFIDLTKDFYFSYSYDLTHSLQYNYIMTAKKSCPPPPSQEIFEWNHYQNEEFRSLTNEMGFSLWILPIVHGSFEQKSFSIFGKYLDMILIARRSRHFAGTRYLKRGVSVHGKVANDCETEQILQVDSGNELKVTSYLQMRGSIPTYWYQEASVTMPKPPILINRFDPSYLATQEHFVDLLSRYNAPIIVLDLVKQVEKKPRESIVGKELYHAVEELNKSIPLNMQIRYCALDHSRISKSKQLRVNAADVTGEASSEWALLESSLRAAAAANTKNDVNSVNNQNYVTNGRVDILRQLEDIAIMSIADTGIFCSPVSYLDNVKEIQHEHKVNAIERGYMEQRGVLRTNCIDCLDRTNAGQFAVAIKFISVGLRALGLTKDVVIDPSSKILLALMDMFGVMGDRIALQYGGSEAHKKMSFGKGDNAATSSKHGSELLTSIKRYYSNAFTDMVKQDAMNVFLGCYIPNDKKVSLWDLESDYNLHNKALHPPLPYINRLLFNTLRRRSVYEDQKLSREENIDELLKCIPEIDVTNVLSNYFIRSIKNGTFTEKVINSVKRSEQRKYIAKILNSRVIEAVEIWWRDAIHNFYARRSWMSVAMVVESLSKSGEIILSKGYFDKFYRPKELTFFDSIFSSNEYQVPIEISSNSSVDSDGNKRNNFIPISDESDNEVNSKRVYNNVNASKLLSNHGYASPIPSPIFESNDINNRNPEYMSPTSIQYADEIALANFSQNATIDADIYSGSKFQLSRYVREIGLKARTLVSGKLPTRKDGDNQSNMSNQLLDSNININHSDRLWQDDITRLDPIVPIQTGLLYSRYADIASNNWLMFDSHNVSSQKREETFHQALRDYNIDVDAVTSMEQLSIDGYTNSIIPHGIYKGMHQDGSALEAQVYISASLINIENKLEIKDKYSIPIETSNNMIMPTTSDVLSFSSKINKISSKDDITQVDSALSYGIDLDRSNAYMNNQAKKSSNENKDQNKYRNKLSYLSSHNGVDRLEFDLMVRGELAEGGERRKVASGLITESINSAIRYVSEQVDYSFKVSKEVLSCICSNYTSDKTILQYASNFDKESLASSLDTINEICSNMTNSKSNEDHAHLHSILSSLNPIYNAQQDYLKSQRKFEAALTLHSNEVKDDDKNYRDFTLLESDLYARTSNPHLHMNEIAVIVFTKAFDSIK